MELRVCTQIKSRFRLQSICFVFFIRVSSELWMFPRDSKAPVTLRGRTNFGKIFAVIFEPFVMEKKLPKMTLTQFREDEGKCLSGGAENRNFINIR